MGRMELARRVGARRETKSQLSTTSFSGPGGWLPLVVMTGSVLPSSTFREFTLLLSCFRLYTSSV